VLRASAVCEQAGVPTSSLLCEAFLPQGAMTTIGLGMPNLPAALVPGHVGTQTKEELRENIMNVTAAQVIEQLTSSPKEVVELAEPQPRDIVCRGGFQAVNRYFYENELSDGLPIVPPTQESVEQFLRYTDRDPDQILGTLLPDSRGASVWSIAVNGVMAPVIEHIRHGRLRALAMTTARRSPQLPDVPTMDEAGLKGFEMSNWYAVFGPASMPKDIVAKLNADFNRALQDPAVRKRLTDAGTEIGGASAEWLDGYVRTEVVKYAKLVKDARVQLD